MECQQYSIRLDALSICATVKLSYNVFFKLGLNDLHSLHLYLQLEKRYRYAVPVRTVRRKALEYLLKRLLTSSLRC